MIDNFSLAISHGLIALAIWQLLSRDDLDVEAPPEKDIEPEGFLAAQKRRRLADKNTGERNA